MDMETTRRRVKSDIYGYSHLHSERARMLHRGALNVPKSAATSMHVTNAELLASSGTSFTTAVPVVRSEQCENQAKNSVFSNALSSPIRRSLQNYQGGYISGATRSSEQNRGSNSPGSIDSSMDMHAD